MNTLNKEKTKDSYTIMQVADILDQSTEAVRKYILAGKLPATKEGHRYLVQKQDLYIFLKNQ